MPHVVHVVLSLDLGGLERMVVQLAIRQHQDGRAVAVIALERPGQLAAGLIERGIPVWTLNKPPGFHPSLVPRLRRLFFEHRPALVHTHQVGALLYAGPATLRTAVRGIVHTEHGLHDYSTWRRRMMARTAGRFAGRWCCVSQEIADQTIARRIARANRVEVVPNGIDLAPFAPVVADRGALRGQLGLPPTAKIVGCVGRLAEVKDHGLLLRAVARLPDVHLALVGDGPLLIPLQAFAAELKIADRVTFAGSRPDPERWLAAFDVFALPSRSEGLPLAVLEAWASGLPVIATRVGALTGLIDEGKNGYLIKVGDDACLAERIAVCLADPVAASRMGVEGRRLVTELFSIDAMHERYAAIYCTVGGDFACASSS